MTARITAAQAAELLRNATPGPWYGSDDGRTLLANDGSIDVLFVDEPVDTSVAETRLLAAAPALAARAVALESALREMLKWADDDHDKFTDACDLSRALLASHDDTRPTP